MVLQDIYYFADKFVNTFGLVLEAQFIIALLNTILTTIALAAFGFHQLLSLAIMIFILSLIPVAGVIISCVPLSFIAYSQGGIKDVVYILLTSLIVHLLESYVLNPKLMSSKTRVPIFLYLYCIIDQRTLFRSMGFDCWYSNFYILIRYIKSERNSRPSPQRVTFFESEPVRFTSV